MRSELAIFNLAGGRVRVVFATDRLIEAPNWTRDGKALIVNGDGRLFRVALDGPAEMIPIDTGFAVACNNDHGLSPDGREIAISDGSENGESCIYVLPAVGGTPRKVTALTPSYCTAGRRTAPRSPIARGARAPSTFTFAARPAAGKPA